jgi:hypothetical protein
MAWANIKTIRPMAWTVVAGLALLVTSPPPIAGSARGAPVAAISAGASQRGPGLGADDLGALERAWQELLGITDPYNGLSLYIAHQNGTPLVHGAFTLGDAAMQARLLGRTAAWLDRAPRFADLWGRSRAQAGATISFDNLPLPDDARLAQRRVFPSRQGDALTVQTGNAQQFGYLLSTIVRLASLSEPPAGGEAAWRRDLQRIHDAAIDDILRLYWLETPAWHWAGAFPNMRARTVARLDGDPRLAAHRYFRAFTDYDLHIFAIAADLKAAHAAAPWLVRSRADAALVADVTGLALRVLSTRVDRGPDGRGFAFDRGMWDDNPIADFAACRSAAAPTQPCRQRNLTQNISHAQRWPLWLQSFHAAADPSQRPQIQAWREGLARQIGERALRFDANRRPLLANYIDGHDGWANYAGPTASDGNRPSSLTGWSMRHGAWALLAPLDERLADGYRQFCRVIISTDPEDIRFRTRHYGAPGPDRRNGFESASDEFGATAPYVWPCRIYTALGFI